MKWRSNSSSARTSRSGQATTEFSIMLAMFAMVLVVMLLLISAFNEYGWRILSLVGLDYP